MNNNPQYILFFSKHCDHSVNFYSKLLKTPYNDKFIKICVDNKKYNIPKSIREVPTIIVPESNTPLSGDNVFKWLDNVTTIKNNNVNNNNSNINKEIEPFSDEMTGLSDQYSLIDNNNNDQFKRTFEFIDSPSTINTPQELDNSSSNDKIKASTEGAYDRLIAERAMDNDNSNNTLPRIRN